MNKYNEYLNLLKKQFNNRISFYEKRPGLLQLIAPFFHEDGDMVEIFYRINNNNDEKIQITDCGMTLMRLSYTYELDTPNKRKIFNRIINEHGLNEDEGIIYVNVIPEHLYQMTLHFSQAVAKISSMRQFQREVIRSLFYEMLDEYVKENLAKYNPDEKVTPLARRDDLEVDYSLETGKRPIYLFGVKDANKARLTTICCLEFIRANLKFKSFVVHEDFNSLPKKDQNRLTSAADKQFVHFEDFKENGKQFIEREIV